jgi:uncharacterized protein YycO
MTIELSFVTERSIGSEAIRWFTHSDYSHVDVIMPSGQRLGARSDSPVSGMTGVQIRDHDYAKFIRDDRLVIDTHSEPLEHEAYAWLMRQVGKPYDISGLYRSFLWEGKVPWWDEKAWWCSELAVLFVAKAVAVRCWTPASRVAPNDCYIFGGAFARDNFD